jgi:hypothetical protein
MSAGGIVPILAGAAARRRKQEQQEKEEESMATYDSKDLNGWEFKIVRSALGRFSNYQAVQKVCREEAESGWELVEKFDSSRLRFKRRVERRSNDHLARLDPYRTSPGFSSAGTSAALIVGVVLLLIGGVALLYRTRWDHLNMLHWPTLPILLVLVILALLILVMWRRGR